MDLCNFIQLVLREYHASSQELSQFGADLSSYINKLKSTATNEPIRTHRWPELRLTIADVTTQIDLELFQR